MLATPTCGASVSVLDGATMGLAWTLPFVGILLSIAMGPLLFPHVWHAYYGRIALFWALSMIVPLYMTNEVATKTILVHTYIAEYIPFVSLVGALFVVASGLHIRIRGEGGPVINVTIMLVGSTFASFVGTTGAALLFIRPLIRMNAWRKYRSHTVIFFIFTVCNVGGALTALGDPPLFLGFLNGVDFFWTTKHLWPPTVFMVFSLLFIYWVIDHRYHRKDVAALVPPHERRKSHDMVRFVEVEGKENFFYLGIILGAVIMSGYWDPGVNTVIFGVKLELQNILRDIIIVTASCFSYVRTPSNIHHKNQFRWEPLCEVAKLFAAIFITASPVFSMLKAEKAGAFSWLIDFAYTNGKPSTDAFFWLTGWLSSFLDNAPTYMLFFHLAGGNATTLMNEYANVLAAVSCGSVYMGAMTYIGNAPNFIVKSIAEENHIHMPSFFGYLGWSSVILLPLFIFVDLIINWW
ncbi:MAG: sodium:proton antiporter [Alphaproteobacteria bacterium]|nr:MAG: sodium:proton antiporter [Alphaproteobacteria bacterium]